MSGELPFIHSRPGSVSHHSSRKHRISCRRPTTRHHYCAVMSQRGRGSSIPCKKNMPPISNAAPRRALKCHTPQEEDGRVSRVKHDDWPARRCGGGRGVGDHTQPALLSVIRILMGT